MYTLMKLELEEGKQSALPTGYGTQGDALSLFDWETNEKKSIESLEDVQEGWQVILERGIAYHRTSKIREIVKRCENKILFRTQTSLYELKEECYACETQRHSCKHDQ